MKSVSSKLFSKCLREWDWSNVMCHSIYCTAERTFWENGKVYNSPGRLFQATKDLVLLLFKLIAKFSIILVGLNPKANGVL